MRTVSAGAAAAIAGDTVFPITLVELGNDTVLRYNSTNTPAIWNSHVWLPRPLSYGRSKESLGLEMAEYQVVLENYDQAITAWARLHNPRGYTTTVYEGIYAEEDDNGNVLLVDDFAWVEFTGVNSSIKIDSEFSITVRTSFDMGKARGPAAEQSHLCRFRGLTGASGFKGRNCGYAGGETLCDFTYTRCTQLGNQVRFGGFPDLTDRANR